MVVGWQQPGKGYGFEPPLDVYNVQFSAGDAGLNRYQAAYSANALNDTIRAPRYEHNRRNPELHAQMDVMSNQMEKLREQTAALRKATGEAWGEPGLKTRNDLELEIQALTLQNEGLSLTVGALTQSLVGLAASSFNWSEGLGTARRKSLTELLLLYSRPCAHIDLRIQDLCADLDVEMAKERLDDIPPTSWTLAVTEKPLAPKHPLVRDGRSAPPGEQPVTPRKSKFQVSNAVQGSLIPETTQKPAAFSAPEALVKPFEDTPQTGTQEHSRRPRHTQHHGHAHNQENKPSRHTPHHGQNQDMSDTIKKKPALASLGIGNPITRSGARPAEPHADTQQDTTPERKSSAPVDITPAKSAAPLPKTFEADEEVGVWVQINGAKGLKSADTFSKSDPFCVCKVSGVQTDDVTGEIPSFKGFQTAHIENDNNPQWKHEATQMWMKPSDALEFIVYDNDGNGKGDLLGSVKLAYAEFAEGYANTQMQLMNGSKKGRGTLDVEIFPD